MDRIRAFSLSFIEAVRAPRDSGGVAGEDVGPKRPVHDCFPEAEALAERAKGGEATCARATLFEEHGIFLFPPRRACGWLMRFPAFDAPNVGSHRRAHPSPQSLRDTGVSDFP